MRKLIHIMLLAALTACAGEAVRAPAPVTAPVDFTGHWEMDYGRSDNVDQKLNSMYREWQRALERQAERRGQPGAGIALDNYNFQSVVAVARLADLITSAQVLDIEQSDVDIEIRRENDFTLTCVFSQGKPETVVDEFGAEVCGWDASQLVFHMALPDGLDIVHRVAISDDRNRLYITTRVDSRSTAPFTINRFYFRFNPLPENYSCEYTLSRGNVCQSGGK